MNDTLERLEQLRAKRDRLAALAEAHVDVALTGGPAKLASSFDTKYRQPAHIKLLSRAVEETVREAQEGTGKGRLIVSMPPRAGKSYTTSMWTPVWFLAKYPNKNIILASHEGNFAVSWGRKARDLYRKVAQSGFINYDVSKDVAAAGEWETTRGGLMLSRGIGGAITGRGAHLMLIDDPIKDFITAQSATVRQNHWDWWLSTAQTRLEPGAAVVVVMTRWHEDDLVGRLLSVDHEGDPNDWRVLRIPAVGEREVEGEPADALGREEGEPLLLASQDETVEQAIERWEQTRRSVGSYVWAGLYQQRPSEPAGQILRRAWWQYYKVSDGDIVLPDGRVIEMSKLHVVQSWDLTFKDANDGDYVVGQVWGTTGVDKFLLDQWRGHADMVETVSEIKRLRERWPATAATWIEDAANGPAVIATLKRELSGVVPRKPRGSKVARAYAVQGQIESGHVWLPSPSEAGWVSDLVEEAAAFPNGSHDDQVDALTQALNGLSDFGRAKVAAPRGTVNSAQPGRIAQSRRRVDR